MTDPGWRTVGRLFAWVTAAFFVAGSVLFLLVSLRITTPPAPLFAQDPTASPQLMAEFFAFRRAIWPQVMASTLLLTLGFLSLIVLGLALREVLGHGLALSQLVASSFGTAGVLGVVEMLLTLGLNQIALRLSTVVAPEALISLGVTYHASLLATDLLLAGSFFLIGFGNLLAGLLAIRQGTLPAAWGWLGVAVAVVAWVGVLAVLADLGRVFQIVVLLDGAILGPISSVWLGLELGRQPRTTVT